MKIFRGFDEIGKDKNTVISVGTFDGVHRAHRQIIEKVIELANASNLRSLIVTFDPHPQEVLKTKVPDIKLLSTTDEKLKHFERLGIENVLVINFTMVFSKTSAHDFYEKLVCGEIGLRDIVVGYDHGFGHDREGNLKLLYELGKELDFSVHRVEEIDIDGAPLSSTRIRKHLSEGEIEKANALLGYEYSFEGIVVEGDKMGKALGYPTANLKPLAENKAMPKDGVYCVKADAGNQTYYGMMNIGFRPTMTEGVRRMIEVNIFDFEGDIYGEKLNISFLKRLRDEKKFDTKAELIDQIKRDKEDTLIFLNTKFTKNTKKEGKWH